MDGSYMWTFCSWRSSADAAHVTHDDDDGDDDDDDDDGGGDTGLYPIGSHSRASLFIQWDADPFKVPTELC